MLNLSQDAREQMKASTATDLITAMESDYPRKAAEDIETLEQDVGNATGEILRLIADKGALEEENKIFRADIEDVHAEIVKLTNERSKLNRDIESLNVDNQALQLEVNRLIDQIADGPQTTDPELESKIAEFDKVFALLPCPNHNRCVSFVEREIKRLLRKTI